MVKNRNEASPLTDAVFTVLKSFIAAEDLVLPEGLILRIIIFPKLASARLGVITKVVKKSTISTG